MFQGSSQKKNYDSGKCLVCKAFHGIFFHDDPEGFSQMPAEENTETILEEMLSIYGGSLRETHSLHMARSFQRRQRFAGDD